MSAIAIKMTTNIEKVNNLLRKYTAFLNYVFDEVSSSKLYIESVMDGFIVFWQDWESFERSWIDYPDDVYEKAPKLNEHENMILRLGPSEENFPEEGFTIKFTGESVENDKIFQVLKNFYTHMNLGIEVKNNSNSVKVLFSTYDQMKNYVQLMTTYFNEAYELFEE
jgi:hypothetical protein